MTREEILNSIKTLGLATVSPNWCVFFRATRFQEDADEAKDFHEKHYHEITLEELIKSPDFFYRLSPIGFQYYLLAVVKVTLENPTCGHLSVIENILIGLQDCGSSRHTNLFKEWWEFFDRKELKVVLAWLRILGEDLYAEAAYFEEEIEAIKKMNVEDHSYKLGEK